MENNNPKPNILDPYDYKTKNNVNIKDERFALKIPLTELLEGSEFNTLKESFQKILNSIKDPDGIYMKQGIEDIEHFMYRCFGVNADLKIIDSREDYSFYGFRLFPSIKTLNIISRILTNNPDSNNKFTKIENAWRTNLAWFIEMDSRFLYDYSAKFNATDIAILFLYRIQQSMFAKELLINISESIKASICAIEDQSVRDMANSKVCCKLYAVPFIYILSEPNYCMFPKLDMYNIIINNQISRKNYDNAVQKIFNRYGTSMVINRNESEFDSAIKYITNWIFEGINDLKYSTNKFRKNILIKAEISNSPYLTNYLKSIYAFFSSAGNNNQMYATENFNIGLDKGTLKYREDLHEKGIDIYWKKKFQEVVEASKIKFFKFNKTVLKPITQHEIDELKVEITTISSADDKLYLLDKLYEIQERIDRAFAVLADKQSQYIVKNTEQELNKFAGELSLLRQMIISQPIRTERYGLFVKYPDGYEG